MRRTLIIIALVVVLAGIGGAVYFFFFRTPAVVVTPSTTVRFDTASDASSTPPATEPAPSTTPPTQPQNSASRLAKITAGPVVPGMVVVDVRASASSSPQATVQYIERQSGNVYSYLPSTGVLTRISNRTIPGIQSANWLSDGSLAFVRYLSGTPLSTINTYALPASGGTGFFLAQGLSGVSTASTSVLAVASGVNGSSVSVGKADGSKLTQVFTTPLSKIEVSFAGKNRYLVTTSATGVLGGAAYLVDPESHFNRVGAVAPGLTALASPNGSWVFVSFATGGSFATRLINISTGESIALPLATLADKCVWSADELSLYCGVPVDPPQGTYPDDWHQGVASFSDRIWKVDVTGRYAQLVLDFSKETKTSLDVASLAINPGSTLLVFLNKTDGSLWRFAL